MVGQVLLGGVVLGHAGPYYAELGCDGLEFDGPGLDGRCWLGWVLMGQVVMG